MFAASTWFAAGQPPPARPGQAGRWAAGRGQPATVVSIISDGDRLACAGRTYALPSARWELPLTCRPGNNALPACTVTARHRSGDRRGPRQDAPGRTGHGHLMAGRHIAAGLPTASSWFTGGLPAGRPGGTDPLGRLRAVSALFAGTSSAPSVDARRGRLAGGAAGLAPALRIRCGISPAPAWRSAAILRRCLTSTAASVISTKTLRNIIPPDRTGFP